MKMMWLFFHIIVLIIMNISHFKKMKTLKTFRKCNAIIQNPFVCWWMLKSCTALINYLFKWWIQIKRIMPHCDAVYILYFILHFLPQRERNWKERDLHKCELIAFELTNKWWSSQEKYSFIHFHYWLNTTSTYTAFDVSWSWSRFNIV